MARRKRTESEIDLDLFVEAIGAPPEMGVGEDDLRRIAARIPHETIRGLRSCFLVAVRKDLRGFVRWCWSVGTNPRTARRLFPGVTLPVLDEADALPFGWEERNGIDYAGDEVSPTDVHRVLGKLGGP